MILNEALIGFNTRPLAPATKSPTCAAKTQGFLRARGRPIPARPSRIFGAGPGLGKGSVLTKFFIRSKHVFTIWF